MGMERKEVRTAESTIEAFAGLAARETISSRACLERSSKHSLVGHTAVYQVPDLTNERSHHLARTNPIQEEAAAVAAATATITMANDPRQMWEALQKNMAKVQQQGKKYVKRRTTKAYTR